MQQKKLSNTLFIFFIYFISISFTSTQQNIEQLAKITNTKKLLESELNKKNQNEKDSLNSLFSIDPNDKSSFPKEKEPSELERKSMEKIEEIFTEKEPILTFSYSGYITISSIKNVIVYPFNKKETSINIFYNKGLMMIKDSNDVTLFNHEFSLEDSEEIKALTFINRGTMTVKNNNERIFPFSEEKLNKKIHVHFKQGILKVLGENMESLWEKNFEKNEKISAKEKNLKREVQVEFKAI